MDQISALASARSEFDRRLRQVGPGDWDRPTPCSDWNVRALVQHVLGGTRVVPALLAGGTRAEGLALRDTPFADHPVSEFQILADAQALAFGESGALERMCAHPAGDIPGSVMLDFRIGDFALHAWDLARAIGADETLPAELVEFVWAGLQPMMPVLGSVGVFGEGPSGTASEGEPLQTRLLDATGRRP